MSSSTGIDPEFSALPLVKLAYISLQRARDFNAEHADFRVERLRTQRLNLRDGSLVDASQGDELGFAVRVIIDGTWGFAAGVSLTTDEVVRVTEQAVRVAMVAKPIASERIELADEPSYHDLTWVSSYDIDPFEVSTEDKVGLLESWSRRLMQSPTVEHVSAVVQQVRENKFYADSHGTRTTQQRVRLNPDLEIFGVDRDRGLLDSMRTIAPPVGRGWEYLTDGSYDWTSELDELPDLLAAKLVAPSVEAGSYDLVIDPSNLWLTIHESIGHATELDRALGYEANYAGTSFATIDKLGSLQYGSKHLNITGDRTVEHGLSTIGFDDDGVETGRWDIVKDGVLVGYQTDRRMAAMMASTMSWEGRSNGCAFADSPGHIPIQRMANVSLAASPEDISTDDLIRKVEKGIYIVGDKSWSIDMQRYNF
ncbi:MAG: TldD/PmbA family protein, partial [Nocardioidaceae bacterium]